MLIVKQATHTCKPHSFQDSQFGKNKRAFNQCADSAKIRCTVCGQTQSYSR